jgi:phosphatidylglycerophosphate synthase
MRDVALREQKDRLMTPLAVALRAVHPNWLSMAALGVGLLSAAAIVGQAYAAGLALWALNRILDGLDGVVARTHNKQSDFGGYLDLLLDFVVYLAIPIAFIAAQPAAANLWAGILLLSAYVINTLSWTLLSAILEKRIAESDGRLTTVEMPAGLIEGAETIVFYSLFFLLPAYTTVLFTVMAILVFFTAGQRLVWAYKHLP